MKRSIPAIVLLIVCVSCNRAAADDKVQVEMKKDVVLRALVDELERGKDGLKLQDLQRPYFIEYGLGDSVTASAWAKLGALTSSAENRWRRLRTSIRVGSYDQDNTNFSGDYGGYYFGGMGGSDIPIEDDYNAIRQGIWWATDREYKSVIENYERKLAFMKTKVVEDKPPDFSHEDPAVNFDDRVEVAVNVKDLEQLSVDLSKIFLEYPDVQSSSVSISGTVGNKYLVNSEGTRLRVGDSRFAITINATVQADDGMKHSDSINVYARKLNGLPPVKELSDRCRKMIQQLIDLKKAPKLESYTGPVLFEPRAAAALFSQRFASQLTGGQRPVGSQSNPDDFEKKLNKRILPKFLNISDDPTQESIGGEVVLGHYFYDDQGVKVKPVTLVEGGRLKALVMSRNPSKVFKKSTGHGRGEYRPGPSVGCLIVASNDAKNEKALRDRLMEACADEDLEFGIRIAALGAAGGDERGYSEYMSSYGFGGFGGGASGGATPLAMYKVYPDGHEELVRGAEIARFDLKAFKRMLAAGDKPYVLNSGGTGARTVVAPALLFEELDLAKIERDFDKPPILPHPLARGKEQAKESTD